jgi:hypothetical protein
MKFSFTLPEWLNWILSKKVRDDHVNRIGLTGSASTSFLGGVLVVTSQDANSLGEQR